MIQWYCHNLPITRHNNAHYPLQNVIRDKAWKKKGETPTQLKEKAKKVLKNKI